MISSSLRDGQVRTHSLKYIQKKFMPISLRECSDYPLRDLEIYTCSDYLRTICSCETIRRVTRFKYLRVVIDNRITGLSLSCPLASQLRLRLVEAFCNISLLIVVFKKDKRYPTDLLFKEQSVFSLCQLYVKQLSVYIYKHLNTIFTPIPHAHSTCYASNVGLTTLPPNISFTTAIYIASIYIYLSILHMVFFIILDNTSQHSTCLTPSSYFSRRS